MLFRSSITAAQELAARAADLALPAMDRWAAITNPRQVMRAPRSAQLDGAPMNARAGEQASRDVVVALFERSSCHRRRREKEDGKGMGSRGAKACSLESARQRSGARRWCGRRRGEARRWCGRERQRSLAAAIERERERGGLDLGLRSDGREEEVAAGSLGRVATGWIWAFRVRVSKAAACCGIFGR